MDQKFSMSVKDIIFVLTLFVSIAGSWFSQQSRTREIELRMDSYEAIMELKMAAMKNEVAELRAKAEQQSTEAKNRRK